MKTISVILPVNNPEMLNQEDLLEHQSKEHYFKVSYIDTHLKELNTMAEVEEIFPLVLKKIVEAEKEGASAVIIYAFGDVCIKEGRELVSIPVMGLGKAAIHMASMLCRHQYTVIPGQIVHNDFIGAMIKEENLESKFVLASGSICMNPSELKNNPVVLGKLVKVASVEIEENNVDTFTLGCGCFMNVAKKLQAELIKIHKKPIIVVDPVEVPFNLIKALC